MKAWEREMYWDEEVLRIQNEARLLGEAQGVGYASDADGEQALQTEKEGK